MQQLTVLFVFFFVKLANVCFCQTPISITATLLFVFDKLLSLLCKCAVCFCQPPLYYCSCALDFCQTLISFTAIVLFFFVKLLSLLLQLCSLLSIPSLLLQVCSLFLSLLCLLLQMCCLFCQTPMSITANVLFVFVNFQCLSL